jgi:hypothetical protein
MEKKLEEQGIEPWTASTLKRNYTTKPHPHVYHTNLRQKELYIQVVPETRLWRHLLLYNMGAEALAKYLKTTKIATM